MRPIESEEEYEAVLREVEPMFDNEPTPGTSEGDYFESLCQRIEQYEKKHYPI